MSEPIAARRPGSRKRPRTWLVALLAVLGIFGLIQASYWAGEPIRAAEAYRQIAADTLREESEDARAAKAELTEAGVDVALDFRTVHGKPDIAKAKQALVVAKDLARRRHSRARERLARARTRIATLKVPFWEEKRFRAQVARDMAAANDHWDRVEGLENEELKFTEDLVDFLERRKGRWRYTDGRFVFDSITDLTNFDIYHREAQELEQRIEALNREAGAKRQRAINEGLLPRAS